MRLRQKKINFEFFMVVNDMKKLCMYAVFDVGTGACLVHGQKRKDLSKLVYLGSFWDGFKRIKEYGTLKAIHGFLLLVIYWDGAARRRLGKYSQPTDAGMYLRWRGTGKVDLKKIQKSDVDRIFAEIKDVKEPIL